MIKEDTMKIRERLAHLKSRIEAIGREGASLADVLMYESSISEFKRVSKWIEEQCVTNDKVYTEKKGRKKRQYFQFKNTSGLDFRFIAMKVSVVRREKFVDSFEIAAANWKNGEEAKLYFDKKLRRTDALSFNPNEVEYQVIK